jgi:hypothetical protein
MIDEVGQAALNAQGPEEAIRILARACFETLGDRKTAHLVPGALLAGERQYFIAGAFLVTPDRMHHMLVGNIGFPTEQERLLVPIDGGHPGYVYSTQAKLILRNTDEHGAFRQYLKTSRMGSTIFAPMIWKGEFLGQLIMAAQARNTMRDEDLDILVAISRIATGAWLRSIYPPASAFYVGKHGLGEESRQT